uniref:Uncharacterized protein n=1 Tax=Anopheles epiroticus TaxID=199890 RepID=A0A182PPR9_9DIPT
MFFIIITVAVIIIVISANIKRPTARSIEPVGDFAGISFFAEQEDSLREDSCSALWIFDRLWNDLAPADAAPRYQVLEPRKGYVPVYIRVGDEPLSDINPELAAAFREPVARASRSELAEALQADQGVAHSSSLIDSHSASDEHKKVLVPGSVKKPTKLLMEEYWKLGAAQFNRFFPSLNADARPDKYKDYPKKGGYVPVYVQYPNKPHGSISPELAAALQESSGRSSRGKLIQVGMVTAILLVNSALCGSQELNRPVRFSSESSSDEELRNDITDKPRVVKVDSNSSESNSNSNESISNEKEAKEAIKELLKQMNKISKAAAAKAKKA